VVKLHIDGERSVVEATVSALINEETMGPPNGLQSQILGYRQSLDSGGSQA